MALSAHLAVAPGLATLIGAATGPVGFQPRQQGGVEQAVAQRFPGAHLDPLAARRRNELAHRRQRVDVLDDHARIENRFTTVQHQARHLAQRVALEDGVAVPDIFQHELVVELLLGHHHAHLAHVGAGKGSDQFHH